MDYTLQQIASQVRRDIVRMVTAAASGHPGGSMSATDVLTYLFFKEMNVTPETWTRSGEGLDQFFLSAGHISPVLYSLLARRGYFPVAELATFRRFGTRLQGHPSVDKGLPGVNQAAGSLGQGLSVAIGAAVGKRLNGDPHTVYVLVGDGESEEGQIWEAAMSAAHLGNLRAKWEAFGWTVIEADGHDFKAIEEGFAEAHRRQGLGKPVMILWHTEMGHGVDFMAGTCKWHGKNPSVEQCAEAMKQLEETMGDFAL